MKRIKAACLEQTILFQMKDSTSPEVDRQQVKKEYAAYRAHLERNKTPYKIVEESEQPDGSLIVKVKRQNNTQPVGSYLD